MKKIVCLTIFCVGLGMLGLVAQAEISRPTDYGLGADTYVANDIDSLSPNANFGTENRMRLRNNSNNRLRIAYVRFDLRDILVDPANAYVMFETTYMKSGGKIVDVYGLTDESLDYWVESGTGGITFNTAPGLLPAAAGQWVRDETRTVSVGTFQTSSEAAPVILTSNPADLDLAGFIATDTNGLITLLMIGGDDETEIATKEHDTYIWPRRWFCRTRMILWHAPMILFLLPIRRFLPVWTCWPGPTRNPTIPEKLLRAMCTLAQPNRTWRCPIMDWSFWRPA